MSIYDELFELKYRQGVSTVKLIKRFPKHQKRVHEVALLGVPSKTLKKIVKDKKLLAKLNDLKERLSLKSAARVQTQKKPWFIWW